MAKRLTLGLMLLSLTACRVGPLSARLFYGPKMADHLILSVRPDKETGLHNMALVATWYASDRRRGASFAFVALGHVQVVDLTIDLSDPLLDKFKVGTGYP